MIATHPGWLRWLLLTWWASLKVVCLFFIANPISVCLMLFSSSSVESNLGSMYRGSHPPGPTLLLERAGKKKTIVRADNIVDVQFTHSCIFTPYLSMLRWWSSYNWRTVWGFCFRLYFKATAHISLIKNFYKQTLATYSSSKTVKKRVLKDFSIQEFRGFKLHLHFPLAHQALNIKPQTSSRRQSGGSDSAVCEDC